MFISRDELGLQDKYPDLSGVNCEIKISSSEISVQAYNSNKEPIPGSITFPIVPEILKDKIISAVKENSDFLTGENLKAQNDKKSM